MEGGGGGGVVRGRVGCAIRDGWCEGEAGVCYKGWM